MKLLVASLACWMIVQALPTEKVSYKGYQVLQTTPRTDEQLAFLEDILNVIQADIWKPVTTLNRTVIVNVAPVIADDVTLALTSQGLDVNVNIEDVQQLIEQQIYGTGQPSGNAEFNYKKYHDFSEILEWIDTIVDEHAPMASRFDVGAESYEGRPLFGVKISSNPGAGRPAFWIEGGIHAREWISPATVMYIVAQFLDQYASDPDIKEVVDMFDWYFLPVTNPDGYTYTWTSDRLWRKTRSRNAGSSCMGTDPNRNWDLHWCEEGASRDPCSEIYCGASAFSESEVKGVSNYILQNKKFKAFIDVHSFGQYWMSPWGYTTTRPVDFDVQDKGSELAVKALQAVHGTRFVHGTSAETIYVSSGGAKDWAYGGADVKFSYTVELRDTGTFGFLLPANQIIPSGQEMLQAFIAIAQYIHNN